MFGGEICFLVIIPLVTKSLRILSRAINRSSKSVFCEAHAQSIAADLPIVDQIDVGDQAMVRIYDGNQSRIVA